MEKGVERIVQKFDVERWAMSMEVSPETWSDRELRLHLHLSLQRMHGAMVAAFAHDLAVCGACPMASLGLGDVGA
eukprot:7939934-Prorocentrum_lima.AAC.1